MLSISFRTDFQYTLALELNSSLSSDENLTAQTLLRGDLLYYCAATRVGGGGEGWRRKSKVWVERTDSDSWKRLSIASTMIIRIWKFAEILRCVDGFRFREHIAPRYFRRSLHLVTLFAVRREQRAGGVWISLTAGGQHKWIHVERWTNHLS